MRSQQRLSLLVALPCLFLAASLRRADASATMLSPLALHVGKRVEQLVSRRTYSDSTTVTPGVWKHRDALVARGGQKNANTRTMTRTTMETLNLLSGGVAGTVSSTITNPLEVIKAQLQSSNTAKGEFITGRGHPLVVAKQIMKKDGITGFFRGLPPTLVGIIPGRSAYFYAYERTKEWLDPLFPEGTPINAVISGLSAGIVGNTLTNPVWMIRTRMQILPDASAGQRAYAGYGDAIASIWKNEGLGGFYKGLAASYWGCSEGALQFLMYEQFKTRLLRRENERRAKQGLPPTQELPKATYFWSAATAKLFAAIAVYPHEVARTRIREQARDGVYRYTGMWKTLSIIAKEEGTRGLYSGLGVHLLKVVPNSAFMFLTYEMVRSWISTFEIVD